MSVEDMNLSVENTKDFKEVSETGQQAHPPELYFCKLILTTNSWMSYFVKHMDILDGVRQGGREYDGLRSALEMDNGDTQQYECVV